MAVCPKCGRQLSDTVYVPLSQASGGQKDFRCACGYVVTYRQPGYESRIRKQKESETKRNTFTKKRSKAFLGFWTAFSGCIIISLICMLVANIINKETGTGILLFILSLSVALIPIALAGAEISYPKSADAFLIRRSRKKAFTFRILGIILGIGMMAFYILLTLNGGHF